MGESQRNSVPSGGRAVSGDRVRIVTVAFNPGAELAAMFASLRAAAYGLELHVVCVDNSPQPQPATARLCRDNGVTYISRPDNPGFGAATNLGMQAELAMPEPDLGTNPAAILDREQKAPTEEWVMAVNPDIEFPPGAIAALVAGARRNPGGAIYGPALVGSDGQRYPTGRAFARLSNGIGHALLGRIWPGNPWTQAYWGRPRWTGCPVRVCCCGARIGRLWGGSTRGISCTSRTPTWGGGRGASWGGPRCCWPESRSCITRGAALAVRAV